MATWNVNTDNKTGKPMPVDTQKRKICFDAHGWESLRRKGGVNVKEEESDWWERRRGV